MQRAKQDHLIGWAIAFPNPRLVEPTPRPHAPSIETGANRAPLAIGCHQGIKHAHDIPGILVVGVGPVLSRVIETVSVSHLLAERARAEGIAVAEGCHSTDVPEEVYATVHGNNAPIKAVDWRPRIPCRLLTKIYQLVAAILTYARSSVVDI